MAVGSKKNEKEERSEDWNIAEEVLAELEPDAWKKLEASVIFRTDPLARRVRKLLATRDSYAFVAAFRMLLGPVGGEIAIYPSLKIIVDHYIDLMKRATARGIATEEDVHRFERSVRHHNHILQVARQLPGKGQPFVSSERLSSDRCLTCGGMLIARGRSRYCSVQCRRTMQKRRERERRSSAERLDRRSRPVRKTARKSMR